MFPRDKTPCSHHTHTTEQRTGKKGTDTVFYSLYQTRIKAKIRVSRNASQVKTKTNISSNPSQVKNKNQRASTGTSWVIRPCFHSNGVGKFQRPVLSSFRCQTPSASSFLVFSHCVDPPQGPAMCCSGKVFHQGRAVA